MIRGYLDVIKSSGYIEGWAFETNAPAQPIMIAIRDENGAEISCGLAHRFREDLLTAGIGTGWCAFRTRVTTSLRRLRVGPLSLIEKKSALELHRVEKPELVEDVEPHFTSIDILADSDPTVPPVSE